MFYNNRLLVSPLLVRGGEPGGEPNMHIDTGESNYAGAITIHQVGVGSKMMTTVLSVDDTAAFDNTMICLGNLETGRDTRSKSRRTIQNPSHLIKKIGAVAAKGQCYRCRIATK
jgi:hypothetical protein